MGFRAYLAKCLDRLIGPLERETRPRPATPRYAAAVDWVPSAGEDEFTPEEKKYQYIHACVREKTPLSIRYADTDGEITESIVNPIALETDFNEVREPGVLLTAYCPQLKTHRSYWFDLIMHIVKMRGKSTSTSQYPGGLHGEWLAMNDWKYRYIQQCISEMRPILIRYSDADREVTERIILPFQMTYRHREPYINGLTYVEAHCFLRDDLRCFRLDRLMCIEEHAMDKMPMLGSEYSRCQYSSPGEDDPCHWWGQYVIADTMYCKEHAERVLLGCQYSSPDGDYPCDWRGQYVIADTVYCKEHAEMALLTLDSEYPRCRYSSQRHGYPCDWRVQYVIADTAYCEEHAERLLLMFDSESSPGLHGGCQHKLLTGPRKGYPCDWRSQYVIADTEYCATHAGMALRPGSLEEALENGMATEIPWQGHLGRLEGALKNGTAREIRLFGRALENGTARELSVLEKAWENGTAWAIPFDYWAQNRLQNHKGADVTPLYRQLETLRYAIKSDNRLCAELMRIKQRGRESSWINEFGRTW